MCISGNDYFVKRVDLVKRDITIRAIRVSGSEISGCWRGAIGLAASEGEEAGGLCCQGDHEEVNGRIKS